MTQRNLFDSPPPPAAATPERARLARQCGAILERLKRGRATNAELAAMSLKYTSRISDLRKAGYAIEVVSRDYKTGVTVYELKT